MNRYDDGENVLVRIENTKTETPNAILVVVDGEDVWIPRSQIAHLGGEELWIPLWLAEKKGLAYE